MIIATRYDANGQAQMTTDKWLKFQMSLSDVETEAMTWSIADTEYGTDQQESGMYEIYLNLQKCIRNTLFICIIKIDTWWETIGIGVLWTMCKQCGEHFGYSKMQEAR